MKTNKKAVSKPKKKKLEFTDLDELLDKEYGKKGTDKRDKFESEFNQEVIGDMLRSARKQRNMTLQEVADILGINKSSVSKFEKNAYSQSIATIAKYLHAIDAKINFRLDLK